MGIFEDRMGAATISVVSPDGRIRAVLKNSDQLTLTFRPDSYRKYWETELAGQLAELASSAVAGWQQARVMAIHAATGNVSGPVRDRQLDRSEREYRALLAEMEPVGKSPGKCVNLTNTGGKAWRAIIKRGALKKLSEEEFAREFAETFRNLRHDESMHATRARVKVYGPSDPKHRKQSGPPQSLIQRKRAQHDG